MTRSACVLLASCVLLAGPTLADTIRLVDGKTIANVQIVSDGLKEVAYKEGKTDKTVASDQVAGVEYDKKPPQLLEAEGFLLTEDLESAVDLLDAYVKAVGDKPSLANQFKWAPAYAAWRAVEVRQAALDIEGAKTAAGRLLQAYPESRYVPQAYLAKAGAEIQGGESAQAQKTLADFSGVISSQSLSKRWQLECRLAQAQADDKLKADSKRVEYERVLGDAAGMPAVQALAQLRVGDACLAQASGNNSGAKDLRSQARAAFEKVIANEGAPQAVIAAAHAGLGEALFLQGADVDDKAVLQQALLHFLRVATLHRDQGAALAKSLYYAMRCFDLLSDPRRKAEMKREVLALFPNSSWAAEAKKY